MLLAIALMCRPRLEGLGTIYIIFLVVMTLNFRFAVVSDPHIALPQTIWDHPTRFHLVEVSIEALEKVFEHLASLNLDFLLLPGDLTQHGEPVNHSWLAERLTKLPFPAYVIPGNHDVPVELPNAQSIGFADFPKYYHRQGYNDTNQAYYSCEILPKVRLIALNSNQFDNSGKQLPFGRLDEKQLTWLEGVLAGIKDELTIVMVHHNVLEHLPNQSKHSLGRRYMLENAPILLKMLREAKVQLIFTGHLHVQDIAYQDNIYEITTGSLVSYPHPYRICEMTRQKEGETSLKIESHQIKSVSNFPKLHEHSREWIGERSYPFMMKLLTEPPLSLSASIAEELVGSLRYFWADIAGGDARFNFSHFPPQARRYFEAFGVEATEGEPKLIDNQASLFF